MNPYLKRIITSAATWQAICGVFNAVAVSLNPPIPPVIVASVNGLIVAISAGFVVANVQGYAIEQKAEIAQRAAREAIAEADERSIKAEKAIAEHKAAVGRWKGYQVAPEWRGPAMATTSGGYSTLQAQPVDDANAPVGGIVTKDLRAALNIVEPPNARG